MIAKVTDRGSWAGELRCKDDPNYRGVVIEVKVVENPAPVAAASGSYRVNRGGSWCHGQRYARVANRNSNTPGDRYYDLGIRLVEIIEDGKEDST